MKQYLLFVLIPVVSLIWGQDSVSNSASEPAVVPAAEASASSATTPSATGQASVASANGTVEIKKSGTEVWTAVLVGAAIDEKDWVRTSAGSDAEILLPDNSAILLKENSTIDITRFSDTVILAQKQGGIFYKITPVLAGRPPFQISTPTATALVYGTAFAAMVKDAGSASFAVVQGKIGVKGSSGEEVFVKAGEFSRAAAGVVDKPKALTADALKRLEDWSKVNFAPYQEPTAPATESKAPASSENSGNNATLTADVTPANGNADAKSGEAAPSKDEKKADDGAKKTDGGSGKKGGGVAWSVGMGSVTVDGKQWNRLSLRPDIPIGKFGICLDIELFVDDQGNISNKGWNFDNAANTFESIQRKIYYIRYGQPGETFYAKVGALDNVTLGYGLIMYGYSNSLQYPDVRKMGLHTELNDIGALGIGFQGVINNFSDFNRDGALIGTRLSVKPLKKLGLPIISNLSVGGSYVTDMNQRAVLQDRDGDKVPNALDKMPDNKTWAIIEPDYSAYDTTVPLVNSAVQILQGEDRKNNQSYVNKYKGFIEGRDPFSMTGVRIDSQIMLPKQKG